MKIKSIILPLFAVFALAGCGGGGGGGSSSAPSLQTPSAPASAREITCAACTQAQLDVLGSVATGKQAGEDVRLTLVVTQSEYDAIQAWLRGGGGEPPNALCGDGIYTPSTSSSRNKYTKDLHSHHDSFRDTRRWAIVRNGVTLVVDGRQEHGSHLDYLENGDIINNPLDGYYTRHARLANSYREGDIIRVLEKDELNDLEQRIATRSLEVGDYRVLRDSTHSPTPRFVGGVRMDDLEDNGLYLAQPITLPNGEEANNCNAAPVAMQYYVAESGDNAWRTDGGFAFNIRGILQNAAIQTDNFLFAHGDNMRDMDLEIRANPMTVMGIGVYADTGFQWRDGGETQAHYGKMMAVYPLFAVPDNDGDNKNRAALEWDLYASAAVGKVHSSYYEDSRLFGFAAGSFVRHLFGETDEWHLRFRRPLSATEIRPLVFGADMRVGGEESHWRFGLERDLDSDDLDATANWRVEF